MLRLPLHTLFLLAFYSFSAPAHATKRIALVIGNDQYQNISVLQKASADALSYAEMLKSKGFEVNLKTNATRGDMDVAIAEFTDKIDVGDTAVFVYSGHGWSDGSQNYLVGTDVPGQVGKELLARLSISLKNGSNGVIDAMDQKGASLKVAIIDACRDNPFRHPGGTRSIGQTRGLARIVPPRDTFIVFSAGEGQSALDRLSEADEKPNSVFTRVFLPLLVEDVSLLEAVKQTQKQVAALARGVNHEQRPAYYDEVLGSACLSSSCRSQPPFDPIKETALSSGITTNGMAIAKDYDPLETVRAFYKALSLADGEAANALISPGKRSLEVFKPENISQFWGGLPQHLQLSSIALTDTDTVEAEYRYTRQNHSVCRAKATVTTVNVEGRALIDRIDAEC